MAGRRDAIMLTRSVGTKVKRKLTAVIEKHGHWYVGYINQVRGVNTQGRTISSALRNLADAFRLVQEENRRLAKKRKADSSLCSE